MENTNVSDSLFLKYCEILNNLMFEIKISTKASNEAISKKKYRSYIFDKYVLAIDGLNCILRHIIILIKEIIASLYTISQERNDTNVINLFNNINLMLEFIMQNNIFLRLQEYMALIENNKKDSKEFIIKMSKLKKTIIHIFNTTLNITLVFLPNLYFLEAKIKKIDEMLQQHIDDEKILEFFDRNQIDKIIYKVLDINMRSEILMKIDLKYILKEFDIISNNNLKSKTNSLFEQNMDLLYIVKDLEFTIDKYHKKKKSFFFRY